MTHFPPSAVHEQRRTLLRRVGIALSALMVLTVLAIFLLILRTERAHDESTCRFAASGGERSFTGGRVVEEQRSCVPEVEERRYMLLRDGKKPFELARKRLGTQFFKDNRYDFQVVEDAQKRVRLRVIVDGKLSSEFREEDAVAQ